MSTRAEVGVSVVTTTVDVDGVAIAVSREGAGPPVVCLHAVGHGGRDFEAFAAGVRGSHEVVCIDWPGHGRSAADHQPTSAARYADVLVRVLDQLGVTRPILVGNSIGGAAALLFARQRPTRAIVLCNSGGLFEVGLLNRLVCRLFASFYDAGARGARWFPRAFAWYYAHLVLLREPAWPQRERIAAAGSEMAPLLREAWRGFALPAADLRELASTLDVPIWCAWGRDDRILPVSLVRATVKRMRQGSLTVFSAGHSPFLECPTEFSAAFLTRFCPAAVASGAQVEHPAPGLMRPWARSSRPS